MTGALLMVVSDLAAQRLLAPAQLPVGVVTGAVGGVYLAWLLSRAMAKGNADDMTARLSGAGPDPRLRQPGHRRRTWT